MALRCREGTTLLVVLWHPWNLICFTVSPFDAFKFTALCIGNFCDATSALSFSSFFVSVLFFLAGSCAFSAIASYRGYIASGYTHIYIYIYTRMSVHLKLQI